MSREARIPGSVLYVEDDETTRGALGASLARRVESLFVAENGRAGLETFAREAPDVVITDITMPELDGLAMARTIKERSPHTPIIVTTAYSDTQYVMEAIEVGIDGYVLKPVDFPRLFGLVRRNLAIVDHERQAARHLEEQRKLLEELQAAAAKIKTLSGLLPICAGCKKIRNDKGYWERVETYISQRSTVRFSHGLCEECTKKIYGNEEWFKASEHKP
jgi:YesN/AraC family two-component response regulator